LEAHAEEEGAADEAKVESVLLDKRTLDAIGLDAGFDDEAATEDATAMDDEAAITDEAATEEGAALEDDATTDGAIEDAGREDEPTKEEAALEDGATTDGATDEATEFEQTKLTLLNCHPAALVENVDQTTAVIALAFAPVQDVHGTVIVCVLPVKPETEKNLLVYVVAVQDDCV
jgi:hypothetical protein